MLGQLKRALSSRKARTALVGMAVGLAARYGFDVDPEMVTLLVAPFCTVILGIAIEDHGKHGAQRTVTHASTTALVPRGHKGNGVSQSGDL